MAWTGQERRRFPRAIFPCKVVISSESRSLVSHTENIGKGGVRVILEEKLEVLSIVNLEIFVEKERSIKCNGRVVWVKDKINSKKGRAHLLDTGIGFIELSATTQQDIRRLLDIVLAQ